MMEHIEKLTDGGSPCDPVVVLNIWMCHEGPGDLREIVCNLITVCYQPVTEEREMANIGTHIKDSVST